MAEIKRRDFLKLGAGAGAIAILTPGIVNNIGCSDDGANNNADGDQDSDMETGGEATVYAHLFSETNEIMEAGKNAAISLGLTGTALAGKTVFIKPNFVALGMELMGMKFEPDSGEVTKPELLVPIAEQCLKAGAAKVTIGEGAQAKMWDWKTIKFSQGVDINGATDLKTAVDALKQTYGDEKIALLCVNEANDWALVPSTSSNGNVAEGISVSKAYAEADTVISVPVIKTHVYAKMTAAMKNMFGVTSIKIHGNNISRCKLHLAYAHETCYGVADAGVAGSYVDMYKWRKDQGKKDYAIVDGSICLEGSGPHKAPVNDGRTIKMKERNAAGKYFLLAGDDWVAMDVLVAKIINIPWNEIKQLQMLANIPKIGEMDNIKLVGANVADLVVGDWMKPVIQPEDDFADFCSTD